MTERLTLVLGGARSGKSRFAEGLVAATGLDKHYLATAQAFDAEMLDRLAHHRASRDEAWTTHEEPLDLVDSLQRIAAPGRIVLVDCLTLWVTNLMMAERPIEAESERLVSALASLSMPVVLVSNEVGLGIVPDNAMARAFRDHAGRLHQSIAAIADTVYFIAAGLPLKMKGHAGSSDPLISERHTGS
ncbi:bifunctional adenosylcobinamide kinase/adenosylcobinamide-phosphate guanylyltransferase [Xaviernesmea oryzae]|uniref:Bifunctional adenosylcobalamin biosynthesis protein n=1 Tax=Xaviernesmea oryzae TaxID=464029 RepID=A0A1Q9B0Q2_9HYPH|nr:bifunctional adenosylcobinamide kinase/adenosylcobinamide-phosphate guanylyltransferase [Xaviernesmea oryzae]OLP61551.1 bifunctional adenosylcobinamide kinase/adenosylcobinamide-phosphate guanylyltransferase [Xaviernesmea oryzae]SEL67250.1 adenosylcobinamide kinase /adenosylcobinamide-phosphate guanylyltransferase [Xaviernesmea oryzae]